MPQTNSPSRPPATAVPRIALAHDLNISRILTGLWQIADMERGGQNVDPTVAAAAMRPYVDAGISTFDMADHYGSAELICGHYRSTYGATAPAETLTKWVPAPGPIDAAQVRAAVALAAKRLGTDRLELLQFHTWTYDDPAWLDALFHLMELREEGLIKQLGVTNTDAVHWRMALDSGIELVSNQVSFSLLDRRARNGLLPLCRERGVHLLAYGTLAGGLLTDRWLGVAEPVWDDSSTPWSLNKYRRFIEQVGGWDAYQAVLRTARVVADRHGASIASVATRAVLDEPGVAGVIIGARLGESEHLNDTLRSLQLELTEQDRAELAAAVARLRPLPGDCGDEYRRPPFLTASGDLSHHLESLPAPYPTVTRANRTLVSTGTSWERAAGYSRAVRSGDRVLVSGTTANHGERIIGGGSAESQTHFVLDKIEGSLRSVGATLADVVRTRIYVAKEGDVEAVARAHGQRLGAWQPANTLVLAGLVGAGLKVEIEAEALLGS